ncbi:hypothetical protein AC578_3086 [Pseudocercospora eumusae]|uniref:Cytochrome P450 n=1 Tax=Pseudocercospora eumusae TaxID=321146 RepID=A0A139H1S9_9PEZI|nr:hypothetical protein AC578_3086 [Pseudocercospora eumusae]
MNSLTVAVLMNQIFRRRSAWYFTHLSDKYGPIVRIAPGEVMITSADTLRSINAVQSRYRRGPFFTAFRFIPNRDNIFSFQSDADHSSRRSRMAPGYLGRGVSSYDEIIDEQLTRVFALIDRKYVCSSTCSENRTMDLNAISYFYPLDVIGSIALGRPFGYLDDGVDLYRFKAVNDKFFIYAVTLACVPSVMTLLQKWPLSLLMPKDSDTSGFGKIIGVSAKIIDERLLPGAKPRKDMLQAFIAAGLSRDELIQESIVQIVAGTDTIGSTIRTVFACLLSSPPAYSRVAKEIRDRDTEDSISSPVTEAQCRSLPYLQAVLRESMRLYPPLTALAFKQVPPGGDILAGHFLPEGTQVGQNIYGILRDPKTWGVDGNSFVPERWLGQPEEHEKEMQAALDLTFGYGKYKCLGQRLAIAEVSKFLVEFLRRYDFAAAVTHDPLHLAAAFGWPSDRFLLRITYRCRESKI